MRPTITVRGSGGAVQTLDVPTEGTHARQRLDDFVRRGWYVVIDGAYPPETALEPAAASPDGGEPPRHGKGSGTEAWRAHAKSLGIDVPDEAGRGDIISLVDQRGQG